MKNVLRLIMVLSFALLSTAAFAQTSTTGSIEGKVVDVNGAAVPGVGVSVKSPNLISPQSTTTDDQGNYRVLNLPPGKYTVTVEAAKGFAKSDQTVNTTGSNVSTEQFSNFPTARTVQGLYTIAPTVTRSGLRDASGRDRDS